MRKEIEFWWKQAKEDLDSAEKNYEIEKYYVSTFLCQQAVEKALKALCLLKFKEIPQGHSIIHLSKKINLPKEMMHGVRDLNPEYLTTRYPDIAGDIPAELYDEKITERHLETARSVLKWVEKQIQK